MPDLLCMGEPMLEFNQLPPGPDGRVLYLEGHGGDTSNAAIAAARQGASVGYITAIGRDAPGDSFMTLWAREGVDTATVRRTDRALTGVYFVTHDERGHHFLHYREDSPAALYTPDDLPEAAIAAARLFYVSGISQGISGSARAASVIHAAMAHADYAFPGLEDAQVLTGLTDPGAILDFYLRLGCRVVVLKMGGAGAWLADPDRRVRIPPHAIEAVDATGAGDTFCGAFLARILGGDGPEAAARYANVAAALKCTGYGAVAPIPRPEAVLRVMGSGG